jgi:hypothetical protein
MNPADSVSTVFQAAAAKYAECDFLHVSAASCIEVCIDEWHLLKPRVHERTSPKRLKGKR